jgi:hypothetical protein
MVILRLLIKVARDKRKKRNPPPPSWIPLANIRFFPQKQEKALKVKLQVTAENR